MTIEEQLSEEFYRWEKRGRGWQVYPEPVSPEPPFREFYGPRLPIQNVVDDGRRPTFFSSLVGRLANKLSPAPIGVPAEIEEEEPEPTPLEREPMVEFQTFLPASLNLPRDVFEQFFLSLSLCREPVCLELVGSSEKIAVQFAVHPDDARMLDHQLSAYFPDAVFTPTVGTMEEAFTNSGDSEVVVVEFGLDREFMFPLATGKLDPFVAIVGALGEIREGEFGLFQVLFQPVRHPWAESVLRSVSDNLGNPIFDNVPQLVRETERKVSKPLYAVIVRVAAKSDDDGRAWEIVRHLASALKVFANPTGNELIPLQNDDYPFAAHMEDVLKRQSRRTGMLLNSDELISFVHLPTASVQSPRLQRQTSASKKIPQELVAKSGLLLGENLHAGQSVPVRLSAEQRVRHTHIIGASGTGKSTLLFNMIRQDIENGEGLAVLDPHGDLVDKILGIIPPHRIGDVVLVDPSDEEYSIGFNILSAHADWEKNLLASDLVSVFQRLSTSWGDQMGSVLGNAIRAFLESERGGTLADLRRFLLESDYRNEFLKTVQDPEIVYYWKKGFAQLTGNKSIGPVLTRLETFLGPKPIRYMVSQQANRLDFGNILDSGKIFLAKLSEGAIGKENSYLLGALLVAKFQQTAMARQRMASASRRDFWLYIDEFSNFITPSMGQILTGARKYRLGLILAHQELRQLQADPEVASAVLSNCYTRLSFRVSDQDAKMLESGFSSFESKDLQNLATFEAIGRIEKSSNDFNLRVSLPENQGTDERRDEVITVSRKKYATPRAEIEAAIRKTFETPEKPVVAKSDKSEPKPPVAGAIPPNPKPASPSVPSEPLTPITLPLQIVEQPASKAPQPKPIPTTDMGRGGEHHRAIQQRLKTVAEELGYLTTIEKPVLEMAGSVDLALQKGEQTIACEIAVTTSVGHEVENVIKCLQAGFKHVAVISENETRLVNMRQALEPKLTKDELRRIGYYTPDGFIAHLRVLVAKEPPPPPKVPGEQIIKGWKVRQHASETSTEEQKRTEGIAIKLIAESMKRKPKAG